MEQTHNRMQHPPDNNLVWGILCTVLCCIPFGIVSIIKANKVNQLWMMGDHEGAYKAARAARNWALWGALLGPVLIIFFYIVFFVIYAGILFTSY